jgi:hypothetical protein
MSKVILPSGAELEIQLAPFEDGRKLQKAVAKELKSIKVSADLDLMDANFMKDVLCSAIASDEIMDALELCFKRCTYNKLKVSKETWEPEEARGDYIQSSIEVLKANMLPFWKGLGLQLGDILKVNKA